MRYFFHIAYLGSAYGGWQRQTSTTSVQEVLEAKLSEVFKTPITVNGCGRTDAGVHASQYFFHADIQHNWDFDLIFRLNKVLPHDIAVFEVIPMQGLQHARFDATQRQYDYFIHTYKDPFLSGLSSLYLLPNLDLQKMKEAVALLPKYNDYRAFCKSPDKYEHTICNVSVANLYTNRAGTKIRFQISANRFLARMIRIIVTKLIKIGTGELSVSAFESHLISKETPQLILPAYPQGLYLSKITYPYLDIAPKPDFCKLTNEDWIVV